MWPASLLATRLGYRWVPGAWDHQPMGAGVGQASGGSTSAAIRIMIVIATIGTGDDSFPEVWCRSSISDARISGQISTPRDSRTVDDGGLEIHRRFLQL